MTIHQFLNDYLQEYFDSCKVKNIDLALSNALMGFKQELLSNRGIDSTTSMDYFHKMFRQADVFDNGYKDMLFWNLLDESTYFWDFLESKISK